MRWVSLRFARRIAPLAILWVYEAARVTH